MLEPAADAVALRRRMRVSHRAIGRTIAQLDAMARLVGNLADPCLESSLERTLQGLSTGLASCFAWEEQELLPRLTTAGLEASAGALFRQQHAQIHHSVARLQACCVALRREPTYQQLADLRAHLYGSGALLAAHVEQEEAVLLSILNAAIAGPVVGAGPAGDDTGVRGGHGSLGPARPSGAGDGGRR